MKGSEPLQRLSPLCHAVEGGFDFQVNALQRLPLTEESLLLIICKQEQVVMDQLKCEYTRQEGQGSGVTRRGRPFDISYSLMLCKFCGNLEDSPNNTPYCPHKLSILKQRLISE